MDARAYPSLRKFVNQSKLTAANRPLKTFFLEILLPVGDQTVVEFSANLALEIDLIPSLIRQAPKSLLSQHHVLREEE